MRDDIDIDARIASVLYDCTTKSPWKDDVFQKYPAYSRIEEIAKVLTTKFIEVLCNKNTLNLRQKKIRNKKIMQNFTGKNQYELSLRFNLTRRMIDIIIAREIDRRSNCNS